MQTSEEDCIEALRAAASRLGESPTKSQYEALGLTPASATIIRVMDGWNAAKEAAGLETNPSTGSRVQPKPDDVDVTVGTEWDELTVDQRWYYKNREADNRYELERRQELRALIRRYKADSEGCSRCEEDDPACLDFHHGDEAEKEMAVNKLVPYGYSKDDIRAEMERCVLLCANCHRREHYELPDTIASEADASERRVESIDSMRARRSATAKELRHWSYRYRRAEGCRDCDETDPRCLQFHHVDRDGKDGSVGNMISAARPKEDVLAEAEKCEVLCANCHRKEHDRSPDVGYPSSQD